MDCVPNNYGAKDGGHYIKLQHTTGECCLRQVVTVEVSTWSRLNQMYWTPKPPLSNSKRSVVTARSLDTPENPCTT